MRRAPLLGQKKGGWCRWGVHTRTDHIELLPPPSPQEIRLGMNLSTSPPDDDSRRAENVMIGAGWHRVLI